ncbi:glycoside hydrolase family 3 N-terminal domain-containing protein [Balneolaceae bacterium ANBcel3]|nr:glycoside hydrolase family 3 N-terminal domain-containing protein [Balneolaceae bacterium ANBcel3]
MVLRHAEAWIQGHKEEQVHAVLKHFPGHGSAFGDTLFETLPSTA